MKSVHKISKYKYQRIFSGLKVALQHRFVNPKAITKFIKQRTYETKLESFHNRIQINEKCTQNIQIQISKDFFISESSSTAQICKS